MEPTPPVSGVEELSLELCAAERWAECKAIWGAIAEASPHTSFFLTAEWVETWLETFAGSLDTRILVFRAGGAAVGMCLLVSANLRRGPFNLRAMYLNTAGEPEEDAACIEFNNLLCLPGWEQAVADRLAAHLAAEKWDELALSGLSGGPGLDALLRAFAGYRVAHGARPSYYVDLAAIRDSGQTYEDLLEAPARSQLRRKIRDYAKRGEMRTQAAGCVEEALAMLDELAQLHQKSWTERGKPGVFASEKFMAFHRALIRRTFAAGGTQVLRMTAGGVIGLIYVFIYRRKAYFYQSGFQYTGDKRLSPGLVAHAQAIRYGLGAGWKEYDFLAGAAQYKKSLAGQCRQLDWVVLERPGWKQQAIRVLRGIKSVKRRVGGGSSSAGHVR